MRLRIVLLATCLEIFGCVTQSLPERPEIILYGIHGDFGPAGFYGINRLTKAMIFKPFNDKSMKGGQCMSAEDFKKYSDWQALVSEIAEKR